MRLLKPKDDVVTIEQLKEICELIKEYKLASVEFNSIKVQSTSLTHLQAITTTPQQSQTKKETEEDLLFHSSG